jgi:hypothetical protein
MILNNLNYTFLKQLLILIDGEILKCQTCFIKQNCHIVIPYIHTKEISKGINAKMSVQTNSIEASGKLGLSVIASIS